MSFPKIIINGHFRQQRVAGVQRYAHEVITEFDEQDIAYDWVQSPEQMHSDILRQLWIQAVMPSKIEDNTVLWSPTNIGPIHCDNHVITLHDISDQLHPEWFDKKYVVWRQFILPKLLRRVQKVITVSKFSKETILIHFPQAKGKVEVIYNGVRTNFFYPREEPETKSLKKQLNLKKPFILTVGSLDPRKNINSLIEAFQSLPHRIHEEMDLVITGESDKKFTFEKIKQNKQQNIRFTGYIDDEQLPVLYSAAEIFVYPSLFEGFGLPVLEAMACGTPVITSNNSALKEVAGPAITVNPNSLNDISEAVVHLAGSSTEREKMRAKGLKWVNCFTWENTAKKTMQILNQTM